ncbi:MAG: MgtC/SapB family protein [Gemmatimonadaceae bacterium]|nr:MgtC/SapB family protein [Chitinophagaceae bacterium]
MMISGEQIATRLLVALLLGALIGAEREYRDKSAGFRTITLISLGSGLFTLVSILLNNGTTDRIASNIVTGIGFLGAGVIFKSEKGVNGLTTAATIFATSAVGMAAGCGFYMLAVLAAVIILTILSAFFLIEKWLDVINKEREYKISALYEAGNFERFEAMMKEHHLHFTPLKRMRKDEKVILLWKVKGTKKHLKAFIEKILGDKTVSEFEF